MEKKKGISGSTLKMIAIVTMLIDHIGAAVLARLLMVNGLGELDQTNTDAIMQWLSANGALYWTYLEDHISPMVRQRICYELRQTGI